MAIDGFNCEEFAQNLFQQAKALGGNTLPPNATYERTK